MIPLGKPLAILSILILLVFFIAGVPVKGADALMTVQEEKKLGDQVFQELEKNVEFTKDIVLQSFVERMGHSLLSQLGPTPFNDEFYVINQRDPNAFAIPGGRVFVTTGLLAMAENQDEVAGVLSHEIAHVTSRHVADMIDRSQRLSLASLAVAIAGILAGGGGPTSQAVASTAMAASGALTLKYTRDHEREADHKSLQTMVKAGYDPKGIIGFMSKLHRYSLIAGPKIPVYLSTHPAVEERISLLENLVQVDSRTPVTVRATSPYKWIQMRAFVDESETHVTVNYFESAVKTNPQSVDAHFGLGLGYRKAGRFDKSLEAFSAAASLAPHEPSLQRELGAACFFSGKLDQAIETLESLNLPSEPYHPEDLLGIYYLGRAYQEKGAFRKALPLLLRVYREYPRFMEVTFQVGSVYGRLGEKGRSHFYFAHHFKLKKDWKNALLHYRTALQYLDVSSPEREQAEREIKSLTQRTE